MGPMGFQSSPFPCTPLLRTPRMGQRSIANERVCLSARISQKPRVHAAERKCAENYNEPHNKFIFYTALSILIISNRSSFRLLFD